jgi:hypothetical protein
MRRLFVLAFVACGGKEAALVDLGLPGVGEIYCAQWTGNRVLVFPLQASGDVAPSRVIIGTSTTLAGPLGVYIH